MNGKHFLRELRLRNFLSYGEETSSLLLEPLNVFIGPNASGKSNLLEAIGLLAATPRDLATPIQRGGGVGDWLWKGAVEGSFAPVAEIDAVVEYPPDNFRRDIPLRYRMQFTQVGQRMELVDEAIEDAERRRANEHDVFFYYRYERGHPVLNIKTPADEKGPNYRERKLQREDLRPDQSVLSQRKDPDQYPEITYLGEQFGRIRLYREWNLGRFTPPRLPQPADAPVDFLREDWSNLGLVLNDLEHRGQRNTLRAYLSKFYAPIEDITVKVYGGTAQVFLHERGMTQPIPATRLSDGTLRFLCLLAILCHPEPPPVVCLEEPELGLHPDVMPTLAELLLQAAERTQLFVTTHSADLVSELTSVPEAVVVCERGPEGSRLQRLELYHPTKE
jgi:predicted ATPase